MSRKKEFFNMTKLTINNLEVEVPVNATIIQACELAGIEIPRFCYHERLSIAGNCRMCLVEVEGGPPKPVASCAMPVSEGMKVHTDTPMVKKAREGVMEFLLANHPLDCPICDQGGECDLQDQAYQYGRDNSEFLENKRAVKDKNLGPLIKTTMTRCIHCTRCVRFTTDIAGIHELGAVGRGENMQITTYLEKSMKSELSGNVIDLCPVGALTSKPYAFKARSWELRKTETIDVMDALGSNIRIDSRGLEVMRILPRLNEEINEEWISNKTRFCYDGLKYQRLDAFYAKENEKLQKTDSKTAYKLISEKLKGLKGNEIAALSGNLSSFNEIFAMKKLLEKLDSENYDCRLNNEKLSSKNRSQYLFNTTIAGINESDACLLIGVNPRKDAAVLNARLTKKSLNKNYKIGAIGVDADLTYKYENLGDDIESLENIANGKSSFAKTLENSQKPMLIIGQDAVSGKNGEEILFLAAQIAEKYNMTQENFNGFNFLSKSTGLINGLEAGFDKTSTVKILENIKSEKIKLIFLLGVDDNIDLEQLKDCFVVYIGSHGDKSAQIADIILPGKAFSEKENFYINLEGRAQRTTQTNFGPENSVEDAKIICEIASAMSIDLGFKTPQDLEKSITNPTITNLGQITPQKWQAPSKPSKTPDKKDKIQAKSYDFYQTNPITRASPTLVKCTHQIK